LMMRSIVFAALLVLAVLAGVLVNPGPVAANTEIIKCSGTQFDPDIVPVFMAHGTQDPVVPLALAESSS